MHKMSFEVKSYELPDSGNTPVWPAALLIATAAFLAWALEPALLQLWMR